MLESKVKKQIDRYDKIENLQTDVGKLNLVVDKVNSKVDYLEEKDNSNNKIATIEELAKRVQILEGKCAVFEQSPITRSGIGRSNFPGVCSPSGFVNQRLFDSQVDKGHQGLKVTDTEGVETLEYDAEAKVDNQLKVDTMGAYGGEMMNWGQYGAQGFDGMKYQFKYKYGAHKEADLDLNSRVDQMSGRVNGIEKQLTSMDSTLAAILKAVKNK